MPQPCCFVTSIVVILLYALLIQYQFVVQTEWRRVVKVDKETTKQNALDFAWNILIDFESYTKWNTFTYKVDRYNNDFASVMVKIKHPLFNDTYLDLLLSFKFIEITKHERICWRYQMVPEYLQTFILKTKRCMELMLDDDNTYVLLRHFDINMGPLSPIVQLLFKESIEIGFQQMTDDFIKYAKQI